jgi:hypothetical protein
MIAAWSAPYRRSDDGGMPKNTSPRVAPTEEALEKTGWARGTGPERKVVAIYKTMGVDILPRALLRQLLLADGVHKTTIERTLCGLVKKGNLIPTEHNSRDLRLANPDLRWVRLVIDPRERKLNRFGETEVKANADYVRTYLSDRLDDLFENPNAYLVRVLRAVELAGAIAEASLLNRPDALAAAVETYRREWLDKEPNEHRRGLNAARLFEALSVGLFAETYEDDPEVKERLDKHYRATAAERERLVAETNLENARRRATGEPLLELNRDRFDTPKDALRGLVPAKGGMRVGLVRLKAFLEVVGALPEAEKLADWHRLPRPAA